MYTVSCKFHFFVDKFIIIVILEGGFLVCLIYLFSKVTDECLRVILIKHEIIDLQLSLN